MKPVSSQFVTIGAMLFSALLSACGNSGSQTSRISRCAKDYDPVPVAAPGTDAAKKMVQLRKGDQLKLKQGDYAYVSVDVFYHEIENDIRVHLSETQDRKGAFNAGVVCMTGRGIKRDMLKISESLKFVSDVLIDPSGNTLVRHRTMNFRIGPPDEISNLWLFGPIVPLKEIEDTYIQGSPADSFADTDVVHYLNDINADGATTQNYQVISVFHKPIRVLATNGTGTAEIKIRVALSGIKDEDRKKRDDDLAKKKNPPPPKETPNPVHP